MPDLSAVTKAIMEGGDTVTTPLNLDGLRVFDHYPEQSSCFLCGTNQDAPCILIGVDGTADDGNEQAEPVHVRCMADQGKWRIKRDMGIMYARRIGP